MSAFVLSQAWGVSVATGEPRLALIALADSADSEGWARISLDWLATKTRISDHVHLRKALRTLIAAGELRMWETKGRHPLFCLTFIREPTEADVAAVCRRVAPGVNWKEVEV